MNPENQPPKNQPEFTTTQTEQAPASPSLSLEALPPNQALEVFISNPVGFVQYIVDQAAKLHLADLKEEAELKGAINAFKTIHPEFDRFAPFIMQEVATLLQDDPESATASWSQLLENAFLKFQQKFSDTVKNAAALQTTPSPEPPPHMESATNRIMPEPLPVYTREQIASMSLDDFLKNEAAIDLALQSKRIQ